MSYETEVSFRDYAIVACGTLTLELNLLRKSGFLDVRGIEYTKPGRHEDPRELESQLVDKIAKAKSYAESVIVVYGGKFCFIDLSDPGRSIDDVIKEQGQTVSRTNATHCIDMLVDVHEREIIRGGEKVFWLTPGWILFKDYVFQDWDKGKANETFPQNTGGAVIVDAVGFWDDFSAKHPEKILNFSDWMGIPIRPHKVSLSRFKMLLSECALQIQKESK